MMKAGRVARIAWSTIAVSAGCSFASAQQMAQCPAAARDKPTLDAGRLPSARFHMVSRVIGSERNEAGETQQLWLRHGQETAELESGIKLRVQLGGCESYSNAYEFVVPSVRPGLDDGGYWLLRASTLLKEIAPANLDGLVPLTAIARALERRAQDPVAARDVSRIGLAGDIKDRHEGSYRVDMEQGADGTTLTVSYSIGPL